MKIGVCASIERYVRLCEEFPDARPDYCEVNCAAVAAMSEEEFSAMVALKERKDVPVYSCNGFVPGTVRLTGETADEANIRAYAAHATERMAALGASVLVFGSSAARKIEEGFPRERAMEQLIRAGRIFAEAAEKHGQRIAIEPLRRLEDNVVNTVAEGARLAAAVDRPNFFLLADFYHVDQNGEPLEDILRFRDRLIHFHICSARRDMLSEEDIPFVTARLNLLAQIGYRGGISYEGAWPEDSSEANAATVRILRSAAKRCGLAE